MLARYTVHSLCKLQNKCAPLALVSSKLDWTRSSTIKVDKRFGALSLTGSKICHLTLFSVIFSFSRSSKSLLCMLRLRRVGVPHCFPYAQTPGCITPRTLNAVRQSTCTAGGAHGAHMPLVTRTETPNEALLSALRSCLHAGAAQSD